LRNYQFANIAKTRSAVESAVRKLIAITGERANPAAGRGRLAAVTFDD